MLAATATSMLASGLAGEVVSDEETLTPVAFEVQDDVDAQDEAIDEVDADQDDETEIDLTAVAGTVPVPVSEAVADVEAAVTEPAWQLSPPPAVVVEVEPAGRGGGRRRDLGRCAALALLGGGRARRGALVLCAGHRARANGGALWRRSVAAGGRNHTAFRDSDVLRAGCRDARGLRASLRAWTNRGVCTGRELPPPVESQPHFEVPPYFAPVVETPAYHAPVAELGPIAEATPVTECRRRSSTRPTWRRRRILCRLQRSRPSPNPRRWAKRHQSWSSRQPANPRPWRKRHRSSSSRRRSR